MISWHRVSSATQKALLIWYASFFQALRYITFPPYILYSGRLQKNYRGLPETLAAVFNNNQCYALLETITLLVSLTRTQSTETDPAARLLPNGIIHATGAAPRFKVQTKLTGNAVDGWNLQYDIEEAGSLRQLDYEGMSVVFRMERPGSCRDSVITVNVFSGCPKGSAIQYVFPDGISDEVRSVEKKYGLIASKAFIRSAKLSLEANW